MDVLAVVPDLFFRSKVEATAKAAGAALRVSHPSKALDGGPYARVLVDLHAVDSTWLREARAKWPDTPIVGFYSHTEVEIGRQALAAGCTEILPRSEFARRLPILVRE